MLPGEKSFTYIVDWSRDGHYLLYQIERGSNTDLEILALGADRQRRTFAACAAKEIQGRS